MTEKIEAVQRMQNYIELHITEQITLADLAQAAYFSPWYAARIFKELTGLSPADYIRRSKLSKSALRLRDENCRIIDIAFGMGFGSVDSYQRAFYREFSCNPKEYARNPIPLPLFTTYGVKFRKLWKESKCMETNRSVFIQVVEKPSRKVIIKRGEKAQDYLEYCNEVGCDVWGMLVSMKSLSKEPICLWLTEKYRTPNTSVYVQGVEVNAEFDGTVPDGFDIIDLPPTTYLMFQGEPFDEAEYCQAIIDVQNAVHRYEPSAIGYCWDDDCPRIQLEPIGSRGYIELRAVKKLLDQR